MNHFMFTFEIESCEKRHPDCEDEYDFIPVDFGTHVALEDWLEFRNKSTNAIRFVYTCYSQEEVLFAVWHYLIFHDFTKFAQCHHCGTYFATKSLKTKPELFTLHTAHSCRQA
jgi:hypothetical protein